MSIKNFVQMECAKAVAALERVAEKSFEESET